MPGNADLAGVIGTWVAVFLALGALASIITLVFIMRNTGSEHHTAIDTVDAQNNIYVLKHFKLPGRSYLFLTVKVPLLDEPPDAQKHFLRNDKLSHVLWKRKRSTTGWVNLINVVEKYATDLKFGNSLIIRNGDTWFSMHHLWLLIVGLRGRYADQKDGGEDFQSRPGNLLPIKIAQGDSKWQNISSVRRLSGTTGTLWWKRRLDSSEFPIDEICFALSQQ